MAGLSSIKEFHIVCIVREPPVTSVDYFLDNEDTMCRKAYKWLCGLETGHQDAVEAEQLQEERIKKLSSLKQNPRTSLILNINLGIIFSVGLFLYLYFTFHRA
jgi:hypothetical protein